MFDGLRQILQRVARLRRDVLAMMTMGEQAAFATAAARPELA